MRKKAKQDVADAATEMPAIAAAAPAEPQAEAAFAVTGMPVAEPAPVDPVPHRSEPEEVKAAPEMAKAAAPAMTKPAPEIVILRPEPKAVPPAAARQAAATGPDRWTALGRRHGALAAAVAVALGLGFAIARAVPSHPGESAYLVEATAGVRDSRQALVRIGDEVTGLKTALDRLKQGIDHPRADATKPALDRLDQSARDSAERIARLGEQLERVERLQRDPARVGAVTERLDRMEKQIAGLAAKPAAAAAVAPVPVTPAAPAPQAAKPAPAAAPDSVAQTGSIAKPAKLEGWILRDVDDGVALVQSSSGRLREVYRGQTLPGGVRVEAIERRGRAWVVVTSKGLITAQ